MKITLVIASLAGGGAERVAITMAGYWISRGQEVTVITLADKNEDFYKLPAGARRVALDVRKDSLSMFAAIGNNLRRVRSIRKAIRASKPDVVISFTDMTNVLVLLATRGMKVPVIVREEIDPRRFPIGRIWNYLRRVTYPRANILVVLSRDFVPWARAIVHESRIKVLPNPVTIERSFDSERLQVRRPCVMAMGRFVKQKGFDLLLPAFAEARSRLPDWKLVLIGDGPERAALEKQAKELGISNSITMTGFVSNPADYLTQGDLFVMSSRFEGFGLAVAEALACGLPAIVFDCPSGPGEIVRHEIDGLVVPPEDVTAMTTALIRLMGDDTLRGEMASRAPEVLARYGVEQIMSQYDSLIRSVTELETPS